MHNYLIRNTSERLCKQCGGFHKYYTVFCIPMEFTIEVDELIEDAYTNVMYLPSTFIRTTRNCGSSPHGVHRFGHDDDPFVHPRLPVG